MEDFFWRLGTRVALLSDLALVLFLFWLPLYLSAANPVALSFKEAYSDYLECLRLLCIQIYFGELYDSGE